jgi:excisionase family DNA binding protein
VPGADGLVADVVRCGQCRLAAPFVRGRQPNSSTVPRSLFRWQPVRGHPSGRGRVRETVHLGDLQRRTGDFWVPPDGQRDGVKRRVEARFQQPHAALVAMVDIGRLHAMPENRREFLLLDEVARECRAPVASVRYWIASRRLRSIRPGSRRLVSREDLDKFLATGGDPSKALAKVLGGAGGE